MAGGASRLKWWRSCCFLMTCCWGKREVLSDSYLTVVAAVYDGIRLSAIVAGKDLGELTGNARGQRVDFQQGVEQSVAGVASSEHVLRKGRVDRVFAAVAHPESLQRAPPALGARAAAAHLLFVRFCQVMKALSSTVGGAGQRTEGPGAPHGGTRALQVGGAGGLQIARRQPGVDGLERRGGGERQGGHQEQQQARRGPGHSAGQGAVAAR